MMECVGHHDALGSAEENCSRVAKEDEANKSDHQDTEETFRVDIDSQSLIPLPFAVEWTEPELVCSYSWVDTRDNSDVSFVPGFPAKWDSPSLPFGLELENYPHLRDWQRKIRIPDPFGPLFRALSVMKPKYDLSKMDVLADSSTLRILLAVVRGDNVDPGQFQVQLVKNSLVISQDDFRYADDGTSNYGRPFETMFTLLPDDVVIRGHYRVIRYKFGSLEIAVRYEADAFENAEDIEDFKMTLAHPTEHAFFDARSEIGVIQHGFEVPNEQIVELKCMSTFSSPNTNKDKWGGRLWFGRMTKMHVGRVHMQRGEVLVVNKEDTKARMIMWQRQEQENLRKLVDLLMQIKSTLKDTERPIVLEYGSGGTLVLKEAWIPVVAVRDYVVKRHWEGDGSCDDEHRAYSL